MQTEVAKNNVKAFGIEIECRFKDIPLRAMIQIMLTDAVMIMPKGRTTLAVYETYEEAKRAEYILNRG